MAPQWARASSLSRFLDHTQLRHTTVGRIPLDEWSARRGSLYLATHNIQNKKNAMPQAGFKSAIPASERPQIHMMDRTTIGIGFADVQKWQ